jgi:hypothetical protein
LVIGVLEALLLRTLDKVRLTLAGVVLTLVGDLAWVALRVPIFLAATEHHVDPTIEVALGDVDLEIAVGHR